VDEHRDVLLLTDQRRRSIHCNVTKHPTAVWTAQQMIEAFPDHAAPRWLLRYRDTIYGNPFRRRRVASMGIGEVFSSPFSPWHNPRGAPDWVHLARVFGPHDRPRRAAPTARAGQMHGLLPRGGTHLSLEKDSPTPRHIQAPGRARGGVRGSRWVCTIGMSDARPDGVLDFAGLWRRFRSRVRSVAAITTPCTSAESSDIPATRTHQTDDSPSAHDRSTGPRRMHR
jgi:hypothetical protein